ncbi:MAG: NTP transferase domain-containing protein [Bacteroidota bacterium]
MNRSSEVHALFGLLLIGGKSTRMGRDKSGIAYRGMAHRDYLHALLANFCARVYISCRPEQAHDLLPDQQAIRDVTTIPGPLNGLLSAHSAHPHVAWLVLAVDLPNVTEADLQLLVHQRSPECGVTAYQSALRSAPEPLFAIWEPAAIPTEAMVQASNNFSITHWLMKGSVHTFPPRDEAILWNANTPEERDRAKRHRS